jgi:hypothetical protein
VFSKYKLMFLAVCAAGVCPSPSFADMEFCHVRITALNANRYVMGPVNTECDWPRAPFGNWGATSNYGQKGNGSQFEGWRQEGWEYQWMSCTQYWPAPDCSYYNAASCSQQATTRGGDVLGAIDGNIWVGCPYDSDDDGWCDEGGCLQAYGVWGGGNYMTLYELDDWGGGDDLVQSIYYPTISIPLEDCTVWGCGDTASAYYPPSFYDTPSSPALVYAEMALTIGYTYYWESDQYCQELRQWNPRYNCW